MNTNLISEMSGKLQERILGSVRLEDNYLNNMLVNTFKSDKFLISNITPKPGCDDVLYQDSGQYLGR